MIGENFIMLINQVKDIFSAFFNRTLILACSAQIASMIAKLIINSLKSKKLSTSNVVSYGGMPSSHTVFIISYIFGLALDPNFGWKSEILSLGIVIAAIILMDTVRFRGTVDKINEQIRIFTEKSNDKDIVMPKYIAHKTSEVVGGIIFAFFYTFIFYLFFFGLFQ